MTDPTDRLYESLLVLRCQTGDEPAFVELVERYHARLKRFLRPMLRDAHAAEDVLQDVWLDVFRGIGELRAFVGWLYRIARDRAYRVLRRRGERPISLDVADAPEIAETEVDGESDFDDAAVVYDSLQRLPHEQREVLLLRFIESMSYEQIAVAVGCELETVRSRLFYAKRAIRREIEREQAND